MYTLSYFFHPTPNVFPFDGRRFCSLIIEKLYRSGAGFYFAFLRTTLLMGRRVPLPKEQLLDEIVEGI
jgi:hypothetical protein